MQRPGQQGSDFLLAGLYDITIFCSFLENPGMP